MNTEFSFGAHLDWLTVTGQIPFSWKAANRTVNSETIYFLAAAIAKQFFPHTELNFGNVQNGRHYEYKVQDLRAGVFVSASPRPNQGFMVEMSGRFWHDEPETPDTFVGRLLAAGMNITRMDVAVDVLGSAPSPRMVWADIIDVKHDGFPRKLDLITSGSGETLAIGDRTSQFYCRIYDKAAEQGVDYAWLRCELEVKKEAARQLTFDFKNTVRYAAAKMLTMIEGHESELSEALSKLADGMEPMRGKTRPSQSNTESWLYKTVAPAITKLNVSDPDAVNRFIEWLKDNLA